MCCNSAWGAKGASLSGRHAPREVCTVLQTRGKVPTPLAHPALCTALFANDRESTVGDQLKPFLARGIAPPLGASSSPHVKFLAHPATCVRDRGDVFAPRGGKSAPRFRKGTPSHRTPAPVPRNSASTLRESAPFTAIFIPSIRGHHPQPAVHAKTSRIHRPQGGVRAPRRATTASCITTCAPRAAQPIPVHALTAPRTPTLHDPCASTATFRLRSCSRQQSTRAG